MLPPLILLHGALGHPDQFRQLELLLHTQFDIHTLCFRGHGPQALSPQGIPVEELVQQVADYVKENELNQLTIFGYSLGGYVALLYAHQEPDRVKSVLTLATKMSWSAAIAAQERKLLIPEQIIKKIPAYAEQLARWHGQHKWKQLVLSTGDMMQRLGAFPLLQEAQLKAIANPVQMMVGDQDKMVSITETLEATQLIPGASFAVLPSSKHPFEQVRLALLHSLMQDFWKNK